MTKSISDLIENWMNETLIAECRGKNCIICLTCKKAEKVGRTATVEELDKAFNLAREKGVVVKTLSSYSDKN